MEEQIYVANFLLCWEIMDAQNWVYDLNNKCKIEGVGDERPFLQCVKSCILVGDCLPNFALGKSAFCQTTFFAASPHVQHRGWPSWQRGRCRGSMWSERPTIWRRESLLLFAPASFPEKISQWKVKIIRGWLQFLCCLLENHLVCWSVTTTTAIENIHGATSIFDAFFSRRICQTTWDAFFVLFLRGKELWAVACNAMQSANQ